MANTFLTAGPSKWQPEPSPRLGEVELRHILDSASDAILTLDESQTVLLANPAAARMFRCPIEALIGAPLERFLPPAFRADHRRLVQAFGEGEGSTRAMGRHTQVTGLRDDGEEFPVEAAISHTRAGERRLYTVVLRDVTERRQAEAALRDSEARLQRLLMMLPEALVVTSGGRLTFVNDAAQRLFGTEARRLLGRKFLHLFQADSAVSMASRFAALVAGTAVMSAVEERIVRGDGAVRTVEATATLFDDRGGTSILVALRDVSELRQAHADLTDSRRLQQQLERLARVDPLTGLENRRCFEERLEEALARGRRGNRPLALLLLDVDRFKAINDGFGHAGGDQVLKEFAARLRRCARATDTVARIGGDEFAILLEGLNGLDDAERVARKISGELEPEFKVADHLLRVTASIGVALVAAHESDPAAALARADEALYEAKRAGRNTFAMSGWHLQGDDEGGL